jgi:hypothetical protein
MKSHSKMQMCLPPLILRMKQIETHQNYKMYSRKITAKSQDHVWEQMGKWDPTTVNGHFIKNEIASHAKEKMAEG